MNPVGAWRELPLDWKPTPAALKETLFGGQAFRWKYSDGIWKGQWGHYVVLIKQESNGSVLWQSQTDKPDTEQALSDYLSAKVDFDQIRDALPWRSDEPLANALKRWEGLRLLRQPFGETLLAFLCSSTKRIPQIAILMENLASRFGEGLPGDYRALPDWSALHRAGEPALRECGLGYRARYVSASAAYLAERPGWLQETEDLPYPMAKQRLLELPGVGEKIADCVLLFGAGRLEAFPVDTWMIKAMQRLYGLENWRPEQTAAFGRIHFGPYAGYAQQVLFAGERSA